MTVLWTMAAAGILLMAAAPETSAGDAGAVRDLNTHHCLTPPGSLTQWKQRATQLRTQILASAGLIPMPARGPLNARVTGRIEREDFTVENVAIETLPGFYLCGNLYRPTRGKGPFPGIVNPHGHWSNGRLEMQEDVPIAPPPPGKRGAGRANLTAIGVNLARRGFVVFAYDMVGYNDTTQVSHGFAGDLPHWYRGVSLLGLQLWNSIRAVDYVSSLKGVDPARIGCTGASGGGTQTFLLAAVDDRIKVSVPVNMVSASMQGGCLCENGPGLRLGSDNVEIAALAAPRPQLLIAATGDWTRANPTEEWPAIRAVYELYGAGDRTACAQFNYDHNYNIESREAMYAWFERWLGKAVSGAHETPFSLDAGSLRVWTSARPRPAGIPDAEALTAALERQGRDALRGIWPADRRGLRRFRERVAPAFRSLLGMTASVSRPESKRSGEAILIVTVGDSDHDRAEALTLACGNGVQVRRLKLDSTVIKPNEWWAEYRSCYNATPFALAAASVAGAIEDLEGTYRRVNVVGLGPAGPAALIGRAISSSTGSIAVEGIRPFAASADAVDDQYVPGLVRLGAMASATALVAPARVTLIGYGTELRSLLPEPDWPTGALTLQTCGPSPGEILTTLRSSR